MAQEYPPTEQAPAPPRKATAREELVFLTSGAKEKMDKTLAGMKGAGHIMAHGFSKQSREEANAKTIEEKNAIGDKQERIRTTAHMQLLEEKAAAAGFKPVAAGPGGSAEAGPEGPAAAQQPQSGVPAPDHEENADSAMREPENQAEPSPSGGAGNDSGISPNEEKVSDESSDGSSRGRARALAQIPPDSQDYQSG